MIVAELDGLTFSTEPGAVYTIAELAGWYSGPPPRPEVDELPNADGADDVDRVYRSARPITLTGLILADDEADPVWDAFAALMADGTPKTLTVTDAAGVRQSEVTLQGTPDVGQLIGGTARYSVQLLARDPVKYGPAVVQSTGLPTAGGGLEYPLGDPDGALYYGAVGASGRVTAVNTGRAATWPFFRVSGQLDGGFEIRCVDTDDTLRYERVVPAGSTVTIDSRTGAVLIDDVSDASTYLTRDGFFSIPPMGSCEIQFSALSTSSGTPLLEVTSWSGWW